MINEATMLNNRFIDYRFVYKHEVKKSNLTEGTYPRRILLFLQRSDLA